MSDVRENMTTDQPSAETSHPSSPRALFWARGFLSRSDRVQRLVLGATLILLNVYGMKHGVSWNQWVALVIQLDLIVTGMIGWCPMAMACRAADAKLVQREGKNEAK